MSYRATPHAATGVHRCKSLPAKNGKGIRTLLPSLESNLSEVLPNHDTVIRKDSKKLKQLTVEILTRGMKPALQPKCKVRPAEGLEDAGKSRCKELYS